MKQDKNGNIGEQSDREAYILSIIEAQKDGGAVGLASCRTHRRINPSACPGNRGHQRLSTGWRRRECLGGFPVFGLEIEKTVVS